MKSFLITFKPATESPDRGWPLEKLQRLVRRHQAGERAVEAWRFHNRKAVSLGDGRPLQGIGFALSSSDLLTIVQKFFPNATQMQGNQEQHAGKGRVSIVADIEGADVYIDGKLVGETPATFTLSSGQHKVEVKDQNGLSWQRELEVLDGSEVKLTAKLTKS
jgi:hypothetical protein